MQDWQHFKALTQGRPVPVSALSYQQVVSLAPELASPDGKSTLIDLENWLDARARQVAGLR